MKRLQDLQNEFPIVEKPSLKRLFPWKSRVGGIGSGFLNPASSSTIATPVYTIPSPSFTINGVAASVSDVTPGPVNKLFLTTPGQISITLLNTTDDTTYESLNWVVSSLSNSPFQTYSFVADGTYQTYLVSLTLYLKTVSGVVYSQIQIIPPPLFNNNPENFSITVNGIAGEPILLTFSSITTGYSDYDWVGNGITLPTKAPTINVNFIPVLNQTPISVQLAVFENGILRKIINNTINFIIKQPSFNNNVADFSVTVNGMDTVPIPLTFTNTSIGYSDYAWTATGIILPAKATTLNVNFVPVLNQTPITVQLSVLDGSVVVKTITMTINFVIGLFTLFDTSLRASSALTWLSTPQPQNNSGVYRGIMAKINVTSLTTAPTLFRIVNRDVDTPVEIDTSITITQKAGSPPGYIFITWNQSGGLFNWVTVDSIPQIAGFSGRNIDGRSGSVTSGIGPQSHPNGLPIWKYGTHPYRVKWYSNLTYEFSSITQSLDIRTQITYTTAYDSYFSNTYNIPTADILANANYFDINLRRYRGATNNLARVTFQLPLGDKYTMLSDGAVLNVSTNTNLFNFFGTPDNWVGLVDITPFVVNGRVTFGKAGGAQGNIYGFVSIRYPTYP